MIWETIGRGGFTGIDKARITSERDSKYGEGNWRIAWKWNGNIVTRDFAYQLYEDGYFNDSFDNPSVWENLRKTARDVYDFEEADVKSGLDYSIQNAEGTHLQDISIRRVFERRGWKFEGDELIRVRKHNQYWGSLFSPGKIPFHLPDLIEEPRLESWWEHDSIEDFYQSNKVLQVKA